MRLSCIFLNRCGGSVGERCLLFLFRKMFRLLCPTLRYLACVFCLLLFGICFSNLLFSLFFPALFGVSLLWFLLEVPAYKLFLLDNPVLLLLIWDEVVSTVFGGYRKFCRRKQLFPRCCGLGSSNAKQIYA